MAILQTYYERKQVIVRHEKTCTWVKGSRT